VLAFIGWLIIGALAGWIASMIMGRGGYGLIGDIIVGLIGAVVGGFIVGLFSPDFNMNGNSWWVSLIVAVVGAIILIFIVRALTRGRTSI